MNFSIEITDTTIPDGIISIVNQLPDIETLKDEDTTITLCFQEGYIYKTGLVLLSTWRKTLPSHVKIVVDDSCCAEPTKRVLVNSGFKDLVESNVETPSNIHYYPGKVSIQPIVRGYSTEHTISNICKIFEDAAGSQVDVNAFSVLLSELCENAYAHSQFETPGYISAHLHRERCEIVIADSGIGILNSYLNGTNQEAKARINRGASAVDLAIDGLRSSKPTPVPGSTLSYFGYGLFIVRRLMEENRGRLTILSGKEVVNIERYDRKRRTLDKPWKGTFVGLLIDLSNPLPLEKVYAEGLSKIIPSTKLDMHASTPAPVLQLPMKEIRLAAFGNQLLTREVGITIRAEIATLLSSGAQVKVILDDISDLTPSVADECFGKLVESMGEERFKQYVVLAGGPSIVHRLIEFVIGNRLSRK